jgi:hypothetical protein
LARYRKRPIVIEAEQFFMDEYNATNEVPPGVCDCGKSVSPHCHTLEGVLHVYHLDWIVTGLVGEVYPVRDDIFRRTYEPVEPAEE